MSSPSLQCVTNLWNTFITNLIPNPNLYHLFCEMPDAMLFQVPEIGEKLIFNRAEYPYSIYGQVFCQKLAQGFSWDPEKF